MDEPIAKMPGPSVRVWVEAGLPGFHRWPDAPPERDYLANRHRHVFSIRADVIVSGAEGQRDVEFFQLAEIVHRWWGDGEREWGGASCEDIAVDLGRHLALAMLRVHSVSVFIPGEGGSTAQWPEL